MGGGRGGLKFVSNVYLDLSGLRPKKKQEKKIFCNKIYQNLN